MKGSPRWNLWNFAEFFNNKILFQSFAFVTCMYVANVPRPNIPRLSPRLEYKYETLKELINGRKNVEL